MPLLKNNDGTPCCLDTVLELIDERTSDCDFPVLSDLLGADWMVGQDAGGDPAVYYRLARVRAGQLYTNPW